MGETVFEDDVLIIIQARMTSTRLPGKVLLPLCEKPVLQVMLERLENYKNKIIVATTDDGTQNPITDLCKTLNMRYFEGSPENVLERFYLCAQSQNMQDESVVVRLTSDCPLMEARLIHCMYEAFQEEHYDYFSNVGERTFPRGMDVEMFRFKALKDAYENAESDFEKEHVTPYFYKTHPKHFRIGNFCNESNHSGYRLTLDVAEDYEVIRNIYRHFGCRIDFGYEEMMDALIQNPELSCANREVRQKHT